MNNITLHSVRMRAAIDGRHVSGAERIVPYQRLEVTVSELIKRVKERATDPQQIIVHVDALHENDIQYLTSLDVRTLPVITAEQGRSAASRILHEIGISEQATQQAFAFLEKGPAPSGENMRGAILMNAKTGERLEPDHERGIRVSRVDWTDEAKKQIETELAAYGLTHFRIYEALALATKIAHVPGMVAELCWSDDPGYTAGYVASSKTGYMRFPHLKDIGNPKGGRVFFVDWENLKLEQLIYYLEKQPVLINEIGKYRKEV